MALTKVTRSGITDNSVNAAKIEDGTIVDADITPGTITNAKLAGSIANDKLANNSITINSTAVPLGGSISAGSIAWQSVIVSDGSTVTTMVAGRGYFVNNTSASGIVKLPASASAGDTIAIKDYAGNFATNKLVIQRNGHKIQGATNDSQIGTNKASVVLVYIDATKGWLYTNESNVSDLQQALFVSATGGTVATVATNFKVHTFTGDGNFVVSCAGNPIGNNKVDYLVVAGGGGGGFAATGCSSGSGGGGGGGYRESYTPAVSGPYTASPLKASCGALTVTAQTYPITVGAGGGAPNSGNDNAPGQGNPSVFSTITSAGGGAGGSNGCSVGGRDGGSGGGGSNSYPGPNIQGGSGNTPPVSPPQGADGGNGIHGQGSGGGGGAGGCAGTGGTPTANGLGGVGVNSEISGSSVGRSGGGGAGDSTSAGATGGGKGGGPTGPAFGGGNGGTRCGSSLPVRQGCAGGANKGGGGGGGASGPQRDQTGGAGGKGVVIIRYKFQ